MNAKFKSMLFVPLLLLSLVFAPAAHAGLAAFSADPVTVNGVPIPGLPAWIQDQNGVSVGLCFDLLNCALVGMPGFNAANPISFPGNFSDVPFYVDYVTDVVTFPNGATAFYIAFIEVNWVNAAGALVGSATPGALAVPFQRQRMRVTPPVVPGTWTVRTPWDGPNGPAVLDLSGCTAGTTCTVSNDFPAPAFGVPQALQNQQMLDTADAIPGSMKTFLRAVNPAPPAGFLGAAAPVITFTGAVPPNPNSFTITDPAGASQTVSTLQLLIGQLIGATASPAAIALPVQKPAVVSAATVTITSAVAATLGTGAITGANAGDFAIVADTCSGTPLAAAASCTFGVTFSEPAPGVSGAKTAVVSFPTTAPAGLPPTVVNLAGAIDGILPTVTTTTPANNAVNVPANNAITVTFSEPVTGVSGTTFTLTSGGAPVTGTVTFDAASNTAVFTPAANLAVNGNFTATIIAAGITDAAGNALAANSVLNFTTTLPDTTPPAVVSNTPANNALAVPTNSVITVKFNEPVDPATVNETTITVKTSAGAVAGTVTYDTATLTAKFTPTQALAGNQLHTVTVTTGVKSLGGVSMAAAFNSTFASNASPTKPVLVAPASNQTGVATTVDFQWIKSSDSDPNDTVTYKLFYCTNQFMVNCNPVTVAQSASVHNTLAGLGGYGAGLLLAGVFFAGGVKSRRRLFLFFAVLLISGMVATACSKSSTDEPAGPLGPGGSVIDPASLVTKNVSGLTPATTYFWKVVADDGHGGLTESDVSSFKTQ